MSMAHALIPEFDMEMANTRKVLECIPDDKLPWKAGERFNSIGWNANHLADVAGWVAMTITTDELDVHPVDGEPYKTPQFQSTREILALFDKNVATARELLENVSDEELMKPWALLKQGQAMMTMPKMVVIRTWVLNHSIHHRAHLCVYLRLNGIAVPGMYGPSESDSE
ncbi:MAG: DinB family protein [Planctomycetaceae bacterium]|nr:DinB family protein [Planctomycetaceae bacterium]